MAEADLDTISIPQEIVDGRERNVAPIAYQTAQEIQEELLGLYVTESQLRNPANQGYRSLNEQERFVAQLENQRAGTGRAREVIANSLLRALAKDSEWGWQAEWMTIFNSFYDLGMSRTKGEGDGSGSLKDRFSCSLLQTFLIETEDGRLRPTNVSVPKVDQRTLLRGTARFALAAAHLDYSKDKGGETENLPDIFQRALFSKEQIKRLVAEDHQAHPDDNNRQFRLANIQS